MSKYKYQVLNSWNDADDLYVDYIVTNKRTKKEAHACILLKTDDIDDYISNEDIGYDLEKRLKKEKGNAFKLPKTSEISEVLYNIFKEICQSENNMLYIKDDSDLENLGINLETCEILCDDINKYKLNDYFEMQDETLVVYGGLQCCFNDDREVKESELER